MDAADPPSRRCPSTVVVCVMHGRYDPPCDLKSDANFCASDMHACRRSPKPPLPLHSSLDIGASPPIRPLERGDARGYSNSNEHRLYRCPPPPPGGPKLVQ